MVNESLVGETYCFLILPTSTVLTILYNYIYIIIFLIVLTECTLFQHEEKDSIWKCGCGVFCTSICVYIRGILLCFLAGERWSYHWGKIEQIRTVDSLLSILAWSTRWVPEKILCWVSLDIWSVYNWLRPDKRLPDAM